MTRKFLTGCFAVAVLTIATSANAQELFRDNLESGVGWGVNSSSADISATFGFDYGAVGIAIPEAPNTRIGDAPSTGLRAAANVADPAGAESFTVYTLAGNFTGSYQLRFDAWINYDLDAFYNNGQAGTTEFMGGGLGYDNAAADVGPGAQILATGDGGSGSDWRVFADGTFLTTGEMEAGTRNGFDPYYADFLPSQTAPAGQTAQTYGGTDGSIAGSPGFQWITFEINTNAQNKSAVYIEKPGGERLLLTIINSGGDRPYTSDGNIGLTFADFFSSVAANPELQFSVFDNVEVNRIPEPGTLLLAATAGLALVGRRRRRI